MQIALRTTALCAALLAILGTQSAASNWLSVESGLPICRPSGEDRVPIPIWFGGISNTSDRDTPAPPPRASGGTLIYSNSSNQQRATAHRMDTLEIVLSGRYCVDGDH